MTDEKYWFRAKRYGIGWGLPCSWQGWVFFIPWFALTLFSVAHLLPHEPLQGMLVLAAMTAILVGVCYWKGEPDGHLKKR